MKHILKSTLLLLALLLPATATAHDFEVDGIYYKITNDNEVEVTSGTNEYVGEVVIPATVTYNDTTYTVTAIGYHAFYYCWQLSSVIIPNSVNIIGIYAFDECDISSVTIPNSVTTISKGAFSRCPNLTSMTIPNSVTNIGEYAFMNCICLTSVTIPNSVTSIGNSAFQGCSGLTSVTIPNSVTSISERMFYGCTSLTSVTIPNSATTIGDVAFFYCSGLTSVTIPNSVTTISNSAFVGCSGLNSIIVESGNSKYDSRNNCNAIIETSSNTLISGCKNTIIPNSVTSIGDLAFSDCGGLTSVTIPNSITSIGEEAFFGCWNLTSIDIPNSVTSIGDRAFSDCSALTSVDIPNSVTSIGCELFSGCRGLRNVIIPNSVTSIGHYAFENCGCLKEVYCYIVDPSAITMGSYVFYLNPQSYSNRTLHVPVGSLAAYQADAKWSQYFGAIVNMDQVMADTIDLDRSDAVIVVGNTLQLKATVLPEDADNKAIYWASSNRTAATVSNDGLVTAVNVGTATITAMTMDGSNLSAECTITVLAPGDVDADYRVSIADVTELIDMLLRGDVGVADNPAADVNGNGIINIADVVELIDQLLN